jgi:hypothetical protein
LNTHGWFAGACSSISRSSLALRHGIEFNWYPVLKIMNRLPTITTIISASFFLFGLESSSQAENQAAPDAAAASSAVSAPNLASAASDVEVKGVGGDKAGENAAPGLTAEPSKGGGKGFLGDSKLNLYSRNYSEDLQIVGAGHRHAWVQGERLVYQSGFTDGAVGVGIDASLFGAVKLDGGRGTRNMVHVGPNGTGQNDVAWAYFGEYALKLKVPGVQLKYGLQSISNPFLEPYDIRALPPTFKGLSASAKPWDNLAINVGSFNAVNARGADFLQRLSTSYGGTSFDRLSYFGADLKILNNGTLSFYDSRAEDVWNQQYFALEQNFGNPKTIKWTARTDAYFTHDQGAKLQGLIDNKSFSVSLAAQHAASTILVGYQHILSDQFFDFTQETSGIYLSNSIGVDYNAPHEHSIQLHYDFDGNAGGIPGFKLALWGVYGSGVDGSAEAARYRDPASSLHDLYWKAGKPIGGGNHEFGVKPSYVFQDGSLKGIKVALLVLARRVTAQYPSKTLADARLVFDFPIKIF